MKLPSYQVEFLPLERRLLERRHTILMHFVLGGASVVASNGAK